MPDFAYRRGRAGAAQLTWRARLTCGCTIVLRLQPLRNTTEYGCNTGLRHGYRLPWVMAWEVDKPGNIRYNRLFKKEEP